MANAIVSEKRIIVKLIDEFTSKYKIVSSSMQDLTKQIEAFNNKLKAGTAIKARDGYFTKNSQRNH